MRPRLLLLATLAAILGPASCNRVEVDREDVRELARAGRELAAELSGRDIGRAAPERPAAAPQRAAADPDPGQSPTFYRYTDDAGSLRFVSSLEQVPSHLRDRARPAGGIVTRTRAPAPRSEDRPFAYDASPTTRHRGQAEVVVYTAPWCGWCRKTLAWLDQRGVAYDNRDIERSERYRRELRSRSGSTSIPFVEIDGTAIRGYSPERMARLLGD